MMRLTTAQTVASGVASLLLFSGTLFVGYALAESGEAMSASASPAAIAAGNGGPPTISVRSEERIKSVYDRLKLKAVEEPLWGNVAALICRNDQATDALAKARHGRASTITAIQDLRASGEVTDAHAARARGFGPAFMPLYGSVTATRKAFADVVFRSDVRTPYPKAS